VGFFNLRKFLPDLKGNNNQIVILKSQGQKCKGFWDV